MNLNAFLQLISCILIQTSTGYDLNEVKMLILPTTYVLLKSPFFKDYNLPEFAPVQQQFMNYQKNIQKKQDDSKVMSSEKSIRQGKHIGVKVK
jgi:hypothetical protein